ncbi:chemotaxis protein CheA [Leptospira sp. 2 VSF19]|uniref:Chemotaxis protein CheA n=1 Tax=Leptospira soteropolitanensis TaxID=2950025 RepID=A0AAW5VJY1_9LEPT|nr:chemotaxis protein CheA [Leptospira soteropolitanensis]MCW7492301.1 chemotaxis protein CheA [Leptospira soteropolitanensis]MCW7499883.1 chemotaxis protein CheA [Leptospira soteropolitanensis]MCW7522134.1 chemotaxis protein CheA [Leptospira soteropolitanensis]MCW7525988.1 chemotaxis protein CheA [Leptospira soteropolitanensis]MCW7529898.1 chemotaxis protein CheA [Leptospira soteropolitanensis]
MDLTEVIDAYLVESEEFLRDMEAILLRTEKTSPTEEDLNAIFRAVHTIKGTAGMFGFESTVKFTHVVENLLDRLRSHEIPFHQDLTEILLNAKDHLSYLVNEETKGTIPESKIQIGNSILASMKPFQNSDPENSLKKEIPTEKEKQAEAKDSLGFGEIDKPGRENSQTYSIPNYLISFRPNRNVFSQGLDPISFIGYLKKIGTIHSLKTMTEEIPNSNEFDPESCYLGFEIHFVSDSDIDTIRKVFNFIENDSFLHILPPGSPITDLADLSMQLPEEEILLGNLWKEIDILTNTSLIHYFEELKSRKTGIKNNSSQINAENSPKEALTQVQENGELIPNLKDQNKSATIKVDSKRIDNLINRVGELVVSCANMNQLISTLEDSILQESSMHTMRLLNEVREISLKLRMVPIGDTFQKYTRTVRDLGKDLGKEIRLITEGNETELDRNIVDKLGDPLTHLVRNACDHGLETTEERIKKGKPKQGTIRLNAFHEAGSVIIEITDDGNGIQKEKIWQKGIDKGLVSGPLPESEEEIFKLLFLPGFSTATKVTNVSGRGVGLDVVLKNIESLRGTITVKSTPSQGSRFTIRLPLTLAIIDGFLVEVGKNHFIIPMDMVLECLHFTEENKTDANQFFPLRGNLIPFLRLGDYYPTEAKEETPRENIVIVRNGEKKAGIVVERLLGEYQTVIKPMGSVFRHVKGVSGSSILGDGNVALIIDIPSLFERTIAVENEKLYK